MDNIIQVNSFFEDLFTLISFAHFDILHILLTSFVYNKHSVCQPLQHNDTLCYVLSVFRAAMKMANIDHCFDQMFSNPKDSQGVSWSKNQLTRVALDFSSTDGETNLFHCVETSDQGPRGGTDVLRRRLRGARRLFRVHTVAAALACQGVWHDAERILWLQTGRFLCGAEWAVWALLWYAHIPPRRTETGHVSVDERFSECLTCVCVCVCAQVREGWMGMETSLGQKTWLLSETLSRRVQKEEGCTSSWRMGWDYFTYSFNCWLYV